MIGGTLEMDRRRGRMEEWVSQKWDRDGRWMVVGEEYSGRIEWE